MLAAETDNPDLAASSSAACRVPSRCFQGQEAHSAGLWHPGTFLLGAGMQLAADWGDFGTRPEWDTTSAHVAAARAQSCGDS